MQRTGVRWLAVIVLITGKLLGPSASDGGEAVSGQETGQQEQPEAKQPQEPLKLPPVTVVAPDDQRFIATDAVSATKTDTPIIEIPQSISVITREQMDEQGVNTLSEAVRYTPGIQGEPFGFDPRFTSIRIRGFDASDTGLYRDGLQLRNPEFAVSFNPEPYGMERIEVLKGPSSVLYGAGSPGGLVNMVSKRPLREGRNVVELEAGNFYHPQVKLDFSGPIDREGVFSFRLTGLGRNADTQVDFLQNDRIYFAPAFSWRPSEKTTLTLLSYYQHDETKASQGYPAAGTLFSNPNGTIPSSRFTGEPDVDHYRRNEYSVGWLFEHDLLENVTLRQNARYYANDLDQVTIFTTFLQADQRTVDRSVFDGSGDLDGFVMDNQALVKFPTGPLDHKALFGIDFQNVDLDTVQAIGAAPSLDIFNPKYGASVPKPATFLDTHTVQRQVGIYLQDQMTLFDRWILLLAGRYDWAETKTDDKLTDTTTKQEDSEFSGRAGLMYDSAIGLAPYFSYSRSFLPALGTDASGEPFKPETGEQYEAGLKYEPPGWNSLITVAYFDLTRENFVQFDPATFLPVQTGEIRSRGVELEAQSAFDFGLNLIASYTFLDVKITESAVPGEVGQRPTQTPEHTFSLWANYRFRYGLLKGLQFGAGVRYLGSTYGNTPNTVKAPAATLGDLAVGYEWKDVRFQVNIQNVADTKYLGACYVRSGQNWCTFGDRLNVVAGLSYRF